MTDPPGTLRSQELVARHRDFFAETVLLVGLVTQDRVEDLGRERDQVRVGDPRPVESVARLALLVVADPRHRRRVHLRITARGNEGSHAADRVGAASVAGPDEELRVGAHERLGHRQLAPLGEDRAARDAELLDRAEEVIPAAGVQAGGVLAELVEDLVHLERGEDRLDEDRRPDRSTRDPERLLGVEEDVVPEAGLGAAFELRQVEVRPRSASEELRRVVEEIEPEVKQAGRNRDAVDEDVALDEMPAAGPDHESREAVIEAVGLAFGAIERELATDGRPKGRLAADDVVPGRRERVLEVGHEDASARIEGVDHHLRLGRTRDFDPPIVEVRRRGRDGPFGPADIRSRDREVRQDAGVELLLPLSTSLEKRHALAPEPALQVGDEGEGFRGQDLLGALDLARDLDRRLAHGRMLTAHRSVGSVGGVTRRAGPRSWHPRPPCTGRCSTARLGPNRRTQSTRA